jgi:glycosyltransferase involved in cell wall biosynthesis
LLSRAARDYRVLFVEEPSYEAGATPHLQLTTKPGGVRVVLPVLPEGLSPAKILQAQRSLVRDLIEREGARSSRVFWYYTPMALAFSRDFACDLVVFDKMDELSAFRGASPELVSLERELLAKADVVFTGGASLFETTRSRHSNAHLFPSSIEFEHFARARHSAEPDPVDQAAIPHPRLGFFGVIDERMDLDLVRAVADLKPEWHFVMIGPVVKIDLKTLPQRPNIHWLGGKDYRDLPRYLARWDIGLMPFAINESTRFISPTKTPEFLAAGVPVVSTPVIDVVRSYGDQGLVDIARTPAELVRKAQAVLARRGDAWLADVDRHLATGSWDKTWAGMNQLIADGLEREAAASVRMPAAFAVPAE